jgi:hypothetical protein
MKTTYRNKYLSLLWLLLVLVSVTNDITKVSAFKEGSAACNAGKSSVGGDHVSTKGGKKVTSNTLKNAGIIISFNGITVAEGGTATVKSNTATVFKVSGKSMKGIAVRLGAPSGVSTTGVLVPGNGLKILSKCKSPSVGITHKKSTTVSSYTSTIKFPSVTTGVVLDITIVFTNGDKSASHAYGKVTVNFK